MAERGLLPVPVSRLPIVQVAQWAAIPHLIHGFFGRRGGCSQDPFAALNLSSDVGDDPGHVRENWARITAAIGSVVCKTMTQVHGARVVSIASAETVAGEVDAIVTATAGIALSVLTADCVPILMVAPGHHAVAAVHAGWRGTLAGIVVEALNHFAERYDVAAADVVVAFGPSIGGCCYEVDSTIADQIEARWGKQDDAIKRRSTKALVDLRKVNRALALSAGVQAAAVTVIGPCTRCAGTDYFSFRGDGGTTGRQLSFVGWRE